MNVDWNATGAMLSGIAGTVTAVIAVAAALFAWRQVREVNRLNAEDRYLEFHWLAFNNPQFAAPDYARLQADPVLKERYFWFVVGMLMCIERIITTFPEDSSWRSAVTNDIRTHRAFIESEEFGSTLPSFYPYMQRFIAETLRQPSSGPDDVGAPSKAQAATGAEISTAPNSAASAD